jgi:hypothetical protein
VVRQSQDLATAAAGFESLGANETWRQQHEEYSANGSKALDDSHRPKQQQEYKAPHRHLTSAGVLPSPSKEELGLRLLKQQQHLQSSHSTPGKIQQEQRIGKLVRTNNMPLSHSIDFECLLRDYIIPLPFIPMQHSTPVHSSKQAAKHTSHLASPLVHQNSPGWPYVSGGGGAQVMLQEANKVSTPSLSTRRSNPVQVCGTHRGRSC